MKTISFIGSHKNAGKTTVLNFVHQQLYKKDGNSMPICLTSIGINGEDVDAFDGKSKPLIPLLKNSFFITSAEHLTHKAGRYQVVDIFSDPIFKKVYILCKALTGFTIVIEGPNEKQAILDIKNRLRSKIGHGVLLIDGSVDRQFLAHPDISDAIYISMLMTSNRHQKKQVESLLAALSIREAENRQKQYIKAHMKKGVKTILFRHDHTMVYKGRDIPFLDEALKTTCLELRDTRCYLYVNSSVSASLYEFLSPLHFLTIILDNFTCVQNVGTTRLPGHKFMPEFRLFHAPVVEKVFIKQENQVDEIVLPENVTAHNLFRDNVNEIGI